MCDTFTDGSSDECLQSHPDGSGLQRCRLTSALPEPLPPGHLFMQKCLLSISIKCSGSQESEICQTYEINFINMKGHLKKAVLQYYSTQT